MARTRHFGDGVGIFGQMHTGEPDRQSRSGEDDDIHDKAECREIDHRLLQTCQIGRERLQIVLGKHVIFGHLVVRLEMLVVRDPVRNRLRGVG